MTSPENVWRLISPTTFPLECVVRLITGTKRPFFRHMRWQISVTQAEILQDIFYDQKEFAHLRPGAYSSFSYDTRRCGRTGCGTNCCPTTQPSPQRYPLSETRVCRLQGECPSVLPLSVLDWLRARRKAREFQGTCQSHHIGRHLKDFWSSICGFVYREGPIKL